MKYILLCLVLISQKSLSFSYDEGRELTKSQHLAWSKLIHYKLDKNEVWKRLIESPKFYISSRISPESEWVENVRAFKDSNSYVCQFPARALFISKNLNLPLRACSEVDIWVRKINPASVSLVFVTQYISNPASVFGHTFLLFNDFKKPATLSMSFGNAAQIPESADSIDYVLKGLTGGFQGHFSEDPFYRKIQEYSNIENRDLWIYDLKLDENQVELLLLHLWELKASTNEEYLFLTKNCSVTIYNALAATVNELDFMPEDFYLLPIETVKKSEKIISKYFYKPSFRTFLDFKISTVGPQFKFQFLNLISSNPTKHQEFETLSLDLALDYFEFLKSKNFGRLSKVEEDYNEALLISRAKRPELIVWPELTPPKNPINSAGTKRIYLGYQSQGQSALLKISPLYHGLLDRDDGYLLNSEIILFDFHFLKPVDRNGFLDRLDLIKISNFQVSSIFDAQNSWDVSLHLDFNNSLRPSTNLINAEINYGSAKHLSINSLGYILFGIDTFEMAGPQIKIGQIYKSSLVNILADIRWKYSPTLNFDESILLTLKLNHEIPENYNLDIDLIINKRSDHGSLGISRFF